MELDSASEILNLIDKGGDIFRTSQHLKALTRRSSARTGPKMQGRCRHTRNDQSFTRSKHWWSMLRVALLDVSTPEVGGISRRRCSANGRRDLVIPDISGPHSGRSWMLVGKLQGPTTSPRLSKTFPPLDLLLSTLIRCVRQGQVDPMMQKLAAQSLTGKQLVHRAQACNSPDHSAPTENTLLSKAISASKRVCQACLLTALSNSLTFHSQPCCRQEAH